MRFESLSALVQMDGHGPYVWAAYGIAFAVLAVNLWWPRHASRSFFRSERAARARALRRGQGQ